MPAPAPAPSTASPASAPASAPAAPKAWEYRVVPVPVFEVKGWQPAAGADPVFARAGEAAAANIAAEQLAELIAIQAAAGWELLFKTKLDFEGVAPAGIGEPPRGRAAALVFRKAK